MSKKKIAIVIQTETLSQICFFCKDEWKFYNPALSSCYRKFNNEFTNKQKQFDLIIYNSCPYI